jgi:asparagine synthetase B (glutamine-hydrolysing)
LASVLHLRGDLRPQPVWERDGPILAWNGEIYAFDKTPVQDNRSDTQLLYQLLQSCDSEEALLSALSSLRGPWAFVLFHPPTSRIWFARDVFGRRSLCWKRPSADDNTIVIASVCSGPGTWEEVPAGGVFSMALHASVPSCWESVTLHKWGSGALANPLSELNMRVPATPPPPPAIDEGGLRACDVALMSALEDAVRVRVTQAYTIAGEVSLPPAGLLFSVCARNTHQSHCRAVWTRRCLLP